MVTEQLKTNFSRQHRKCTLIHCQEKRRQKQRELWLQPSVGFKHKNGHIESAQSPSLGPVDSAK